jgi:myo-inositol-1(or 4)-monophosphatase
MDVYRTIATEAARAAGSILSHGHNERLDVIYKGEYDLVTNVDYQSEEAIVARILKSFPDHQILAEEGHGRTTPSPFKWIIDPLDGTANYAHRFPFYCVSIALEVDGVVCLGVIYDPVRDELFVAERGKGATVNQHPITVSGITDLEKGVLVTGFSYDVRRDLRNVAHFKNMIIKAQAVRRTGSAALDLCYVAAGRADGLWEMKLHPWDTAAGALMVLEAGGIMTDFSGGPFSPYAQETLASNGLIHTGMIEILQMGST